MRRSNLDSPLDQTDFQAKGSCLLVSLIPAHHRTGNSIAGIQNENSSRVGSRKNQSAPEGVEQSQDSSGNSALSETGGALSGAIGVEKPVESTPIGGQEERLTRLVKAWDTLPEHVRQTIVAIVDASTPALKA